MKISDLIELAKAGYKPNDVKELLASEPKGPEPKEPEPKEPEPKEPDPKEPEPKEPEPKGPEPDYKALYEKTLSELKKVQSDNRKNQTGKEPVKTDEDIAIDFANNLFV